MKAIPFKEDEVFMIFQKGKPILLGNNIGRPSDYDMDLSQATKKELLWWQKCLKKNKFVKP